MKINKLLAGTVFGLTMAVSGSGWAQVRQLGDYSGMSPAEISMVKPIWDGIQRRKAQEQAQAAIIPKSCPGHDKPYGPDFLAMQNACRAAAMTTGGVLQGDHNAGMTKEETRNDIFSRHHLDPQLMRNHQCSSINVASQTTELVNEVLDVTYLENLHGIDASNYLAHHTICSKYPG